MSKKKKNVIEFPYNPEKNLFEVDGVWCSKAFFETLKSAKDGDYGIVAFGADGRDGISFIRITAQEARFLLLIRQGRDAIKNYETLVEFYA